MATRRFSRYELEALDVPYSCIWEEHTHDSRWANHFEGVFLDSLNGKAYMVAWQCGKSEGQEDMDTWYDEDIIEAEEAEKYQVTETKWRAI